MDQSSKARIKNPVPMAHLAIFGVALLLLSSVLTKPSFAQSTYEQKVLEIQQHIQQNDLEGARALIVSASKDFPSNGGLENLEGVIEIQQGHTAKASAQFKLAIEHSRHLASAYLNLGRIYMQTAETDPITRRLATDVYQKLLLFEPQNPEGNYQLASILTWDQHYRESLSHLAKLPAQDRQQIGALSLLCTDYAALGDKAQTDSTAAELAANPDLTEQDAAEVLPALRTARRADLIEALYTASNQHHALSPGSLRTLGLAQEANGKLTESRATLESAFTQQPNSTTILVDLTRIAKAQQDYQGALGYLAHARELAPKDASLPYEFGAICLRLHLIGEARKALEEAVKLAPDNFEYNLGIGIVSSFAQDPTGALPYLYKAHTLRPTDPDPILALGTTCFRAKNFDDAIQWLTQAASNKTTAAEAHFYLGRVARQQNRLDDAEKELNIANTLRPDNPDTLAELGQLCITRKQYPQAQQYLDHAIALEKDNYIANFALLQLYARTSDPRRDEQSKRFDQVKEKNDEQYKETMRIINVRPDKAV